MNVQLLALVLAVATPALCQYGWQGQGGNEMSQIGGGNMDWQTQSVMRQLEKMASQQPSKVKQALHKIKEGLLSLYQYVSDGNSRGVNTRKKLGKRQKAKGKNSIGKIVRSLAGAVPSILGALRGGGANSGGGAPPPPQSGGK